MKLKSIELLGFKSFQDKTRIDFDGGLTAVVGPNGSGKSNISDAVRWVLGEMSLKSLRGAKMEDVIFNGTQKRPAANYTYVSLFLDTSEEYATRNENAGDSEEPASGGRTRLGDDREVVVTRKYYRSGESEYYINKKQVRLKDIYELFYDTGIGREGYSVIGQGKISEVLSVKGDERRSIFEEAAGISKYRYRKNESERKLRDTENNLVRINDILGELGSRIGPLEKEAENAKKYLVLSEERKGLEITLWLEKIDKIRKNLSEHETMLASVRLELDQADGEISRLETENDRFVNEGYELMRKKSELERKIADLELECENIRGINAVLENDIIHLNEKTAQNIVEGEQLKKEAGDTESALEELEEEKRGYTELFALIEKEKSDYEEKYKSAYRLREEAEQAEQAANHRLNDALLGVSEINAESAGIEAMIASLEKSGSEYTRQIESSRERLTELKTELDNAEKEKAALSAVVSEQKEKNDAFEQEINQLKSARVLENEGISEIRMKLVQAEQKREGLQRLEKLFEGYSDAVRTVLSHGRDGKIQTNGKNAVIYGTAANLLSTDGEYVVALETSLGAAVQFIAVETEADAKSVINYLKNIKGGRATFLPLDTIDGRKADVSGIKSMTGYIGVASDLVRCEDKYERLAVNLLGRTVIAEDMDSASEIAKKCGYRLKIVTKDGQIINTGGSYTGGSSAKKVGVFTRNMDIERLDGEIKELNTQILEREIRMKKNDERIAVLESEAAIIRMELSDKIKETESLNIKIGAVEARFDEENERLAFIEKSGEIGRDELSELNERLESAVRKKTGSDQGIEAARSMLDSKRAALSEARSAEANALEEFKAVQFKEVEVKSRYESFELRIGSLINLKTSSENRLILIAAENESNETRVKEISEKIIHGIKEIEAKTESVSACRTELNGMDSASEEREAISQKLRSDMKLATMKKEQAFQSFTSLESKYGSEEAEYETLTARLWDEYELTYSSANEFRLPEEKMLKAPSRLNSLKSQIRAMRTININAVEEYRETKARYDFLKEQTDDLIKTRRSLDSAILKLNDTMKTIFTETFNRINLEFNEVFVELFGGGSAKIELSEPDLPLESGIEIKLRPPGKSVKNIALLSGGEQSFAAIALYLSLQNINPSPFCIFDEIETALDDANLIRFVDYIKRHCDKTQYIMITHRRGTMERADVLYGITMHEKGVSDYIRLDLDAVDKNIKEYIN